jgi:hypothetical protein
MSLKFGTKQRCDVSLARHSALCRIWLLRWNMWVSTAGYPMQCIWSPHAPWDDLN